MAQYEFFAVAPSGVSTVFVPAFRHGGTIIGNHVRPNFIHVGIVAEIDHIWREAAAGAHIYFEGDHVSFFSEAFMRFQKTEKFKMDETAFYSEAFHRRPSCLPYIFGKILDNVVNGVVFVIYDIHDGVGSDIAGLKHRITIRVNDGIVGIYFGIDKFFHNIGDAGQLSHKEALQFFVVFKLISMAGAYAVVRLCDNRITGVGNEFLAGFQRVSHTIAGNGNAGFLIVFLHSRFEFDTRDILGSKTCCDVKFRAQFCVALQPVFIVGFQPVDLTVLVYKKCNASVYFLIIFQTIYFVIFI